jgi:bile acid-coenzyme A ligase
VASLSPRAQSFPRRCSQHASDTPERPAIVTVDDDGSESHVSCKGLDTRVRQFALRLRQSGVDKESAVIIALPSGPEHFVAALAAWRLGACVLPLSPEMPLLERRKILSVVREWRTPAVVGTWESEGTQVPLASIDDLVGAPLDEVDDVVPWPGKAIGSGGSTGTPKVIVDPKPWAQVPGQWGALSMVGLRASQIQLVLGSLYHNVGFMCGHLGLFEGHTLIVPRRFNAAQAAELFVRHQVQFAGLIPIMMQRMAKLPEAASLRLPHVEGIYHSGGACPEWVKRQWLAIVSPEHLWELYGSTEDIGLTMISGREWLTHSGSVGRPYMTDIAIFDAAKHPVPNGEVGEIHMRPAPSSSQFFGETWPSQPGFMYVGTASSAPREDGFASVGDLGWLDDDGYLYLADRRVDMIKSGGVNVYPAEVEAALTEHTGVADAVVIGVPDAEWGHRVHAVIQPARWPAELSAEALDVFLRQRLSAHKAPKTYEFVQSLPRDASGKIRRSALRDDRREGRFVGSVLEPAPRATNGASQPSP